MLAMAKSTSLSRNAPGRTRPVRVLPAPSDACPAACVLDDCGSDQAVRPGLGNSLLNRQQLKYVWIDTHWRPS
jgi:hypothetical protein